ncbi:hypothetical protein EHS39_32175 [Ensifer sp. MPMI2T]|nr:hypothetical protein EHS39_32175 [Ensifer sp. MPMI2T]
MADLVVRAGLAASKSEARRVIAGRGVRLDGEIVEDAERRIDMLFVPSRLSLGRKRHVVIRVAK